MLLDIFQSLFVSQVVGTYWLRYSGYVFCYRYEIASFYMFKALRHHKIMHNDLHDLM